MSRVPDPSTSAMRTMDRLLGLLGVPLRIRRLVKPLPSTLIQMSTLLERT